MTTGDVYTIAGSSAGTPGDTGNGGTATSEAEQAVGVAVTARTCTSPTPATTGSRKSRRRRYPWRESISTTRDMYTAGQNAAGTGSGVAATAADLNNPDRAVVGQASTVHRRLEQQPGPGGRRHRAHRVGPGDGQGRHLHRRRHRAGCSSNPATAGRRSALLDSPSVSPWTPQEPDHRRPLNNEVRQVSASTAVISDSPAGRGRSPRTGTAARRPRRALSPGRTFDAR